jgi:hypothetical protein
MEGKSTEELLGIWKENNREQWSDEAFEAVRRLLAERDVAVPAQTPRVERPQPNAEGQLRLRSASTPELLGFVLTGLVIAAVAALGLVLSRNATPPQAMLVAVALLVGQSVFRFLLVLFGKSPWLVAAVLIAILAALSARVGARAVVGALFALPAVAVMHFLMLRGADFAARLAGQTVEPTLRPAQSPNTDSTRLSLEEAVDRKRAFK